MDRKSRMEKAEGDRWESDENTVGKAEKNSESERNTPAEPGRMPNRPPDDDRAVEPGRGNRSEEDPD